MYNATVAAPKKLPKSGEIPVWGQLCYKALLALDGHNYPRATARSLLEAHEDCEDITTHYTSLLEAHEDCEDEPGGRQDVEEPGRLQEEVGQDHSS